MIPFNKPYLTGNELEYIKEAVEVYGHISGNGIFTKKCQRYFENQWGFIKCLLTTSCTDALEMCALLLNIEPGDEVIIPSYTFVSTALAFVRQGAAIRFADSCANNPNVDENKIEELINHKTKAIVLVHYAGIACNMEQIMKIANKHNLFVVEDAAQAIDSYYVTEDEKFIEKIPLGRMGHLSCFSFHETKNIQCGEGGMLCINDERFTKRAEILWEKGTNRAEFFRGEINKYGWVDTGSSFLPSEITAGFLYAQLENLDNIQARRVEIWNHYYNELKPLHEAKTIHLPVIFPYATNNAHMFYFVCKTATERTALIKHLKSKGILCVFHYLSLHKSEYYKNKHSGRELPNSDRYSDCLIRLPLYYELSALQQNTIIKTIINYYECL
jgi:dTDP-4-amino-4,6-dideoxygalactose transaminase